MVKLAVEWAPRVLRIFEPLRLTYPLHVADDSSIDNFRDYAEVKDAEQLVPVGPRVAPFYLRQRLPCIGFMKNDRV